MAISLAQAKQTALIAYNNAFPGGKNLNGVSIPRDSFVNTWANRIVQAGTDTVLRDALRGDKYAGGVYKTYRDSQAKTTSPATAPTAPSAPGSANYEKDLNHLGDTTKQQTMAGWGWKWEWTDKSKNQGVYTPSTAQAKAKYQQLYGKPYTSPINASKTPAPAPAPKPVNSLDDLFSILPDEIKNDPMFKQMSNDEKGIIALYMKTLNSQNDMERKKFETALDMAAEQAGPYWREKINLTKDELKRTLGTLDADLESRETELMRRRQKLEEDLTYERGFLSAEEQSQLSQIKLNYDVQLEGIREDMARKGLTSSTIKNQAVDRNEQVRGGLIESTQRRTARDIRNLETGTQFDIGTIQQQIEDFRRATTESKTSAVRAAEGYLGSKELGSLPGANPYLMGDTVGSMLDDKASDILTRAQGLTLSGMGT